MLFKTETKLGSDCTGNDGDTNRVLTLQNTGQTSDDGLIVVVGYSTLAEGVDFTIVHLTTNSQITFLGAVYNSQSVIVTYQESVSFGSVDISNVSGMAILLNESFNNIPSGVSANLNYFVELARQFVSNYVGVNIDPNSIDPVYQNPIIFYATANLLDIIGAQIGAGEISLSELKVGDSHISTSAQENRLLGEMALKNIGRKQKFFRSLS